MTNRSILELERQQPDNLNSLAVEVVDTVDELVHAVRGFFHQHHRWSPSDCGTRAITLESRRSTLNLHPFLNEELVKAAEVYEIVSAERVPVTTFEQAIPDGKLVSRKVVKPRD